MKSGAKGNMTKTKLDPYIQRKERARKFMLQARVEHAMWWKFNEYRKSLKLGWTEFMEAVIKRELEEK